MPKPVNVSTGDPSFNPRKPVKINGYLFMPATADQRLRMERGPIVKRAGSVR